MINQLVGATNSLSNNNRHSILDIIRQLYYTLLRYTSFFILKPSETQRSGVPGKLMGHPCSRVPSV